MSAVVIPFTTEDAWLDARTMDITSTESAALFGLSPYITAFELWHRKRSGEVPAFADNEAMEEGRFMEPAIAAWCAHIKGWEIEPLKSYWRLPDLRMGSSFDYVITNLPDGPALLECKNVRYDIYKRDWIEHDDGYIEASPHIEMQVQHQLAVSGFKRNFICAKVGAGRPIIIERERDEPVIASIRAKIASFWKSVDEGNEPPPVFPDDAEAIIAAMAYAQPGKILDASSDVEIAALCAAYREASNRQKLAEEDKKVAQAKLLTLISDAERVIAKGFKVSATMVADSPGTLITPDLVGTYYGARRGYRRLTISPTKEAT